MARTDHNRTWLFRFVLGALILVAGSIGVATALNRGSSADSAPTQVALGQALDRFPSSSLTDWVSYADQVSEVLVLDETRLALPAGAHPESDDGYVARQVTLEVEKTLWRSPSADAASQRIPFVAWGWMQRADELMPFGVANAPRLEVGRRYLIALAEIDTGWTALADAAVLSLEGDTVTSEVVAGEPSAVAESLAGASTSEVQALLDRTSPDPVAAKYADLEPEARWRAVSLETGPRE